MAAELDYPESLQGSGSWHTGNRRAVLPRNFCVWGGAGSVSGLTLELLYLCCPLLLCLPQFMDLSLCYLLNPFVYLISGLRRGSCYGVTLGSEEQHTPAVLGSLGHLSLLHSGKDPGRTDVTGPSDRVWLACFWPRLPICGKENVVPFPPTAIFFQVGILTPGVSCLQGTWAVCQALWP